MIASSVPLDFLVIAPNKGARCFDPSSGRVFISRHVIFDELSFPFATIQSPGSTNGTSYDDMVFIPVVRTEVFFPVTPPPIPPAREDSFWLRLHEIPRPKKLLDLNFGRMEFVHL